jgi:hypothetical protein
MSSPYSGSDTFVNPITIPDDGDPAAMAIMGAAIEGLVDCSVFLLSRVFPNGVNLPLAMLPFVSNAGDMSMVITSSGPAIQSAGSPDDYITAPISLPHGVVLQGIELVFVANASHTASVPTGPQILLKRHALAVGAAPGAASTVFSDVYTYASQAIANNLQVKIGSVSGTHTVDSDGYAYFIVVVDESGPDAFPGNTYYAVRIVYQPA